MVNQQYLSLTKIKKCLSLTKIKKCLNLTRKNSLFKGSSWFWRILGWWVRDWDSTPLRINSLPCQVACLTSWKMTTNIERNFFFYISSSHVFPSILFLSVFFSWLLERWQKIPFHLSGLFSVSGLAFFLNSTFHSSVWMNRTRLIIILKSDILRFSDTFPSSLSNPLGTDLSLVFFFSSFSGHYSCFFFSGYFIPN